MFRGLFIPGLKLQLLAAGPVRAPALPGSLGAALWVCTWGDPSVSVCLSVQCCGLCHGGFNLLALQSPDLESPRTCVSMAGTCLVPSHGASVWANIHLSWGHQSILGASVHLPSVLGQGWGSVSSHITGLSLWLPWPVTIQINNPNKSPCASLGK